MNPIATAFADVQRQLSDMLSEAGWPSPETAFADHVFRSYGKKLPGRSTVTDRLMEAPILASVGYQYAAPSFERPGGYDSEWSSHFERLASRNPFPIDRESYFYRPLELIGLCLGARNCPTVDPAHREWLRKILDQGRDRLQSGTPTMLLSAYAASQLDVRWDIQGPRGNDLPLPTLCLMHWLSKATESASPLELGLTDSNLEERLLNIALTAESQINDVAEGALVLCATSSVLDARIQSLVEQSWAKPVNSRDALRIVENIGDRFPVIVNALKKRHNNRSTVSVTDEYDVQDLLGALLKVHFEDVRPEEWTPGYAGNSSRVDFLLKAFGLVVEVKMTRKNLDQKEIVNQLATDILRYQAHSDCKTLFCFVYDPEGKCRNPAALQNDLTKRHGSLDVVVMVRPMLL